MIYLSEKYWNTFDNNGVMFEKLCNYLIKEMITKDIERTKRTRDHGHDLEGKVPVLNDDYMIIWGECKYHSSKLSLQKVSSTLVMAYLNDVDCLYFFSYSPINRNFEQQITDFCTKSKIRHKIYDDIKLEQVLLEYQDKKWFHSFFPKYQIKNYDINEGDIKVHICLKKNISDGSLDDSDKEYMVNEIFEYKIYIQNDDVYKPCKIKIQMIKDASLKYIEVSASPSPTKYTKTICVSPCSSSVVIYKLRIISYKPELDLPQINITYNQETLIFNKKISLNWLAEVPLLGSKYSDFLTGVQKNFTGLNQGSIIYVYGRSGCGKSRILSEISSLYDKYAYQVLSFDAEHQQLSVNKVIRKIVSTLEGLPDYIDEAKDEISLKKWHLKMAYNILYNYEYDINKHEEEIKTYLSFLLYQHRTLITFDNLQDYSTEVTIFCKQLMTDIFREKARSVIVVSINIDKVLEDSIPDNLHDTLVLWASKYRNHCITIECTNFNSNIAQLYLRKTLLPDLSNEEYFYENTITKIIDTVGTNPFILQQTLLLLKDKDIITLSPKGTFYFSDIDRFEETLNQLSNRVESVLKLRENELLNCIDIEKRELYIYVIAVIQFFHTVSQPLYIKLFHETTLLNQLKRSGFIKVSHEEDISFYHNCFASYYSRNSVYKKQLIEHASDILYALDALSLRKHLNAAYFILNYYSGTLNNELINEGITNIIKYKPLDPFFSEYSDIMLKLITNGQVSCDQFTTLNLYKNLCHRVTSTQGIIKGNIFYKAILEEMFSASEKFHDHPALFFKIIKEYASNLNQSFDSNEALSVLDQAEKLVLSFSLDECLQKEILSSLYNRRSVPLKDLGKRADAEIWISKALSLSIEINNYALCISNYHDYGYLYYNDRNEGENLVKFWDLAFQTFREHLSQTDNKKIIISSNVHAIISDLVKFAYADAKEKLQVLLKHKNSTKMSYYENKILLVQCLYYILGSTANENNEALLKMINESQDLCVFHNYSRDYYKPFYLMAIYDYKCNRFENAAENYFIALRYLLTRGNFEQFPLKYHTQIIDIIIHLRRLGYKKECQNVIKWIKSTSLKKTLNEYLNISEEEFAKFYLSYQPSTPIIDQHQPLGYPAI